MKLWGNVLGEGTRKAKLQRDGKVIADGKKLTGNEMLTPACQEDIIKFRCDFLLIH